jgi:hypothetical protein
VGAERGAFYKGTAPPLTYVASTARHEGQPRGLLSFSPHSALSGLAQRTRSSLCSFAPLCTAHLWMPLASLSHPLRNRPRRHLRRPTVEQLCNPSSSSPLAFQNWLV